MFRKKSGKGRTLGDHVSELVVLNDALPQLVTLHLGGLVPLTSERLLEVPLPVVVRDNLGPKPTRELARQDGPPRVAHVLPHEPHGSLACEPGVLPDHEDCLPETLEEAAVQSPEVTELGLDDVAHFLRVLPDGHAEVAAVGETGDRLEKLYLGEGFGQEEE